MRVLETTFESLYRWDLNAVEAEIFRQKHPDYLPLEDCVEDASVIVKPASEPDKSWPVYGVNNVDGVVFSHHQLGQQFRQGYKRIAEGWFVHNPTRANVGSFGRVPAVEPDAITSPDYQVWRLTGGYLPEFMSVILRTKAFRYLVSIHRVGAVKQRLFVANLQEIVLPRPELAVQKAMVTKYEEAIAEASAIRSEVERLVATTTDLVLDRLGFPRQYLDETKPAESVDWSDMERWDLPFFRRDFVLLEHWLQNNIPSRPLSECVTFRFQGWTEHDFPDSSFQYIEIGSVKPLEGIVSVEDVEVSEAPSRAQYRVYEGDILIATTRPYLAKIARVGAQYDGAVCSSGFSVIAATDSDLDKDYLLLVLQSPIVVRQLKRRMSGGSYPAITQQELEKVLIPIPDMAVQKELVAAVNEARAKAVSEKLRVDDIERAALEPFERLIMGS